MLCDDRCDAFLSVLHFIWGYLLLKPKRILFLSQLLFILLLGGCGQAANDAPPPLVTEIPPPAAFDALTAVSTHPSIPIRDMTALTRQLRGLEAPRVAQDTPTSYAVGDVEPFWFKDLAAGSNEQINARLVYRSDALNMWVQEDAQVDDFDVVRAGQFIGSTILPTNRAIFGREWSPGVDGDPRINVLHLKELRGLGIAYFSSSDEYVTAVNPYSNQREMLYVSLQAAEVGSDRYYATIAHELQHMSLWHIDRNEDAWASEGLSELAVHLNGYPTNREQTYASQPDIQLTDLQHDPDAIARHYAAAFLFTTYFHDRFGDAAVQALVQHAENGPAGFDAVLAEMGTGLTFDDLFADWLAANYLNSIGREQGVYSYTSVMLPPLETSTGLQAETAVNQYGADFIAVSGTQPVTLDFTGTQQVSTIAATPHSGSFYWVSYPADESDMHLTRAFDLTGLDAATLTFWSWYDLEEGWDYGYTAVSTDGGTSWTLLESTTTTTNNPQGNGFGPGYTGSSGGWVQETADLTPFAGREILLRFQVVTDDAVHLDGWAIDDIAIPELGYADDAEDVGENWQAEGFVRLTATLPQRFLVQQILLGDETVQVKHLPLNSEQQGRWTIPLSAETPEAIIIVAGMTPFTRETAAYAYEISNE